MLSVQNLGCAGMERLGSPSNSSMLASLSSQRDNRSIRRPPKIPVMKHDLIFSTNGEFQQHNSNSGIKFDSYDRHNNNSNNVYTSCTASKNCPTHIPRHDGEFGRDTFSSHNQSNAEIKRSYIKAPPNRTIQDVPDASINLQPPAYLGKNCQKSAMMNKSDKAKGIKGFIMKMIDNNSGNANSNSTKSGTDYKTNNNLFAKSNNVVQNSSINNKINVHDESSEASFQSSSSSSSSTLLDYNSL